MILALIARRRQAATAGWRRPPARATRYSQSLLKRAASGSASTEHIEADGAHRMAAFAKSWGGNEKGDRWELPLTDASAGPRIRVQGRIGSAVTSTISCLIPAGISGSHPVGHRAKTSPHDSPPLQRLLGSVPHGSRTRRRRTIGLAFHRGEPKTSGADH